MTLAEIDTDVKVWADNAESWAVFELMGTQWRMGAGGPIGLDYSALREIWLRAKVPPSRRDDLFSDLRVMEAAAIEQMREDMNDH